MKEEEEEEERSEDFSREQIAVERKRAVAMIVRTIEVDTKKKKRIIRVRGIIVRPTG